MLWHAAAVAGPLVFFGSKEAVQHAVLHWQEAGHHHHDDGGFQEDPSPDAQQHVLLDDALSSPALCSAPFDPSVGIGESPPPNLDEAPVPSPFVEGLRRPPRHLL